MFLSFLYLKQSIYICRVLQKTVDFRGDLHLAFQILARFPERPLYKEQHVGL